MWPLGFSSPPDVSPSRSVLKTGSVTVVSGVDNVPFCAAFALLCLKLEAIVASVDMPPIPVYERGDWGPLASVEWMAAQGRTWFDQCPVLT